MMNDIKFQTSYEEFVQKIRQYKKNSTLMVTANQCWHLFNQEKENFAINHEAILSRIFAIAMATANNHRSENMDVSMLNRLKNDYFFIKNGCSYEPRDINSHGYLTRIPADLNFYSSQVDELASFIKEDSKFVKYRQNISEDNLKKVLNSAFVQRELGAQIENPSLATRNMARAWAILEFLKARLDNRFGLNLDLNKFLESAGGVNMQPLSAFVSAIAIVETAKKSRLSGLFCIDNIKIGESLGDRTQITIETLNLLASKLTASVDMYQKWHGEEVLKEHPYYQKYVPNIMYSFPLLNGEELSNQYPKNSYFCPSPSIFLNHVSELFLNCLVKQKEYFKEDFKINIISEIGMAYEDYILSVIPTIFKEPIISSGSTMGTKEQNADFIIETENAIWVIECKKSIGGRNVRTLFRPKDIAGSFARLLEACEQCSTTISKISAGNKPIIPIILVSGAIIAEGIIFQQMAYESQIFKQLNLKHVEIFSLDNFEKTFLLIEEKNIVAAIQQKWVKIDQGEYESFYTDVLDIAPMIKLNHPFEFPHLVPHYDKIFGSRPR